MRYIRNIFFFLAAASCTAMLAVEWLDGSNALWVSSYLMIWFSLIGIFTSQIVIWLVSWWRKGPTPASPPAKQWQYRR